MLFNSYAFLFFFLPLAIAGHFLLGRSRPAYACIFTALTSLIFYAMWSVGALPLLIGSILTNYLVGRALTSSVRPSAVARKALLIAGLAGNLLVLGYFKYALFATKALADSTGLAVPIPEIVLPLGVSFFTFTQIAYLVDAYQGKAQEYDFSRYLLFVTYFPHLIAGPIIHHREMMPQFADSANYRPNGRNLMIGMQFLVIGLFKKVVFADSVAVYGDKIFAGSAETQLTFFEAWLGALAYTTQIYFDFSGYSDMAVGLARMMNIRLPFNFASPYQSGSISEFWRRWHMTLSRFLRDYLYIPLGGNRRGPLRRSVNMLTTMLLGGLWHGAGWTYIVWGALHGVFLMINHLWRGTGLGIPRGIAWALTFVAVVVAWVFFRAPDLVGAWRFVTAMFGGNGISIPPALGALPFANTLQAVGFDFRGMFHNGLIDPIPALSIVGALLAIAFLAPNSQQIIDDADDVTKSVLARAVAAVLRRGIAAGAIFALALTMIGRESPFLYFQF